MAQYIKNADIFGRVGSGIGAGLAEQIPKEIERNRLASGLNELGEQKDLTPFQQFARLSSIPGVTPQMIQSGSDLLRQQARGQALAGLDGQKSTQTAPPFPSPVSGSAQPANQTGSNVPSITKGNILETLQQGWQPRSEDEKFTAAGQKYNANPAFYGNDPQRAIDYENQIDATEEKRFLAAESQNERLSNIQRNLVSRLSDQSKRLNTQVPAELYSKIEDEAIQATKPRSEGGRGISEQQAMKEYGNKLNDASRQFEKISQLGNWGITMKPSSETLRAIKQLQGEMENLDQTDNAALKMVRESKVSPQFAYAVFQPVRRVPELAGEIKKLPNLEPVHTLFESKVPPSVAVPRTQDISPRLAEFVKNNEKASPLSIAY